MLAFVFLSFFRSLSIFSLFFYSFSVFVNLYLSIDISKLNNYDSLFFEKKNIYIYVCMYLFIYINLYIYFLINRIKKVLIYKNIIKKNFFFSKFIFIYKYINIK